MFHRHHNDYYFYLSGFLSLSLFILVLFVTLFFVMFKEKPKVFALTKDKYIAVSIDITPKQKSKNSAKPAPKPTPKPAAKPKPSEPAPDISDLFSNVKSPKLASKPKVQKKQVDTKRIAAIEKRIKTSQKTTSENAQQKIKELALVKPSIEISGASSSSAHEVNEYYAKIQALIYDNFFPPVSTEGSVAQVKIYLSAQGKLLDFRVLTPSGNTLFNKEVDALAQRLSGVTFPISPDVQEETLSIYLTVQE